MSSFTYGAELELSDWDRAKTLPPGYAIDTRDVTMVNSNGIAVDPKAKLYQYGGEINTPPTDTVGGQLDMLAQVKRLLPEATVNYRSNLHIHIRLPGLGTNLTMLKQVQTYIHANMPKALLQIEPLPRPQDDEYPDAEELDGARRRWRRRRVSHQTLLTYGRLTRQLEATSVEEFYELEVPASRAGTPQWHFQPRLCVNLRQHRETDTVEFRHFPGTLDLSEFHTCLRWCQRFLLAALADKPIEELLELDEFQTEHFPAFEPYCHWQEMLYRVTTHDHTVSKHDIRANISKILEAEDNMR